MERTVSDIEPSVDTPLTWQSATVVPRFAHIGPTLTTTTGHVLHATPSLPSESGWLELQTDSLGTAFFQDVLSLDGESRDSLELASVSMAFPGIAIDTSLASTTFSNAPDLLLPSDLSGSKTSACLDMKQSTCQDWPFSTVSLSSPDISPSSTHLPPHASLGPLDRNHRDYAADHIDYTTMFIVLPLCLFATLIVFLLVIILYFRHKKKNRRFTPGVVPADLYVNAKTDITLDPLPLLSADPVADAPQSGETIFRVVHPFKARQPGQLNLELGSTVVVFETAVNGWWRGREVATDRMGWFPGAFVQELQNDAALAVIEKEASNSKLQPRNRVSSFQLKKRGHRHRRTSSEGNGDSSATLLETAAVLATPVTPSDDLCPDKGCWFRACYDYKAVSKGELTLTKGDRVQCLERDAAGWMLGVLSSSESEGWFPAVYVSREDQGHQEDQGLGRGKDACYQQLEVNKNRQADQDWLGIEHRAICTYHSSSPEDLVFGEGDRVVVFRTMDNGWWLGYSRGQSGWFPGSYVQVVEQIGPGSADRQSVTSLGSVSTNEKTDNSSRVSLDEVEMTFTSVATRDLSPARVISPSHSLEVGCQGPMSVMLATREKNATPPSSSPSLNCSSSDTQARQGRRDGRPVRPAPPPPTRKEKTSVSCNTLPLKSRSPGLNLASTSSGTQVSGAASGRPQSKPSPPSRRPGVKLVRVAGNVVDLGRLGEPSSRQPPPSLAYPNLSARFTSDADSLSSSPCSLGFATACRGSGNSIGKFSEHLELGNLEQDETNAEAVESAVWVKRDRDAGEGRPGMGVGREEGGQQPRTMGVRPWASTARPREPLRVLPPSLPPAERVEVRVPKITQEPIKMAVPAIASTHDLTSKSKTLGQRSGLSEHTSFMKGKNGDGILSSKEGSHSFNNFSLGDHNVSASTEACNPDMQGKTRNISLLDEQRNVTLPTPSDKADIPAGQSAAASGDKGRERHAIAPGESEGAENTSMRAVAQKLSSSSKETPQRQSAPPFARPPPPKSPPPKAHCVVNPGICTQGSLSSRKKPLRRAVRSFAGQNNGELSFEEGTYIKDIRQSMERTGWNVGMLADGTTGLYRNDCVEVVADTAFQSVSP